RLSGKGEPIGTRAGDLSAWDKLVHGWLSYDLSLAGQTKNLELGPHEYNTAKPQAAIVALPPKEVTTEYGPPFAGEGMYWSTSGDDLSTTMTREVDLTGATTASLDLQARLDIEAEYATCTSRPPPTGVPPGRAGTARSTASRSTATGPTARACPAPP